MSATMHRRLQRLAEDELGKRPHLSTCANILRDAGPKPEPLSKEEWLSTVFVENIERLRASAEKKAAATQPESQAPEES